MHLGFTNPMGKEFMDDSSIGAAMTESSTYASNAEDSLEEKKYLIKKLFEQLDEVIDEVMASARHMRNHNSVSADMLSKI